MLILMSDKDINRFKVLQDVLEHRLSQVDAAQILDILPRQVRRLLAKLKLYGVSSLVHGSRGQPSNNKLPETLRAEVPEVVRTYYADFAPTFACEKLSEDHNLCVSKETLRQWMIADGLWVPHAKRKPRIHQPR
ncbi:hypothetical protein MACH26_27170 [Planctobacterium marinum]|uniref:Insertion element IS150 protein InsJ-like helix-turn-helix domain-containing protein n=1 Tax=Planctobacterium marinum TaxID=1631968 RepID=A0AA48HLW1_9ALTE|nr:hypothetical protein MACH26_27170 [Planctobacterium marinum]